MAAVRKHERRRFERLAALWGLVGCCVQAYTRPPLVARGGTASRGGGGGKEVVESETSREKKSKMNETKPTEENNSAERAPSRTRLMKCSKTMAEYIRCLHKPAIDE